MSARRARGTTGVVALLGLVAGCTGAGSGEAPPTPTAAATAAPGPEAADGDPRGLLVLAVPAGYSRVDDVSSSGWTVHLAGDRCTLVSRGTTAPRSGDASAHDLSVAALDSWREGVGGRDAGAVDDVLVPLDGEPVVAGVAPTGVNFVTQDWSTTVDGLRPGLAIPEPEAPGEWPAAEVLG